MVFSSLIFLLLFLPVFLGLYYLTPGRFRTILLFAGSMIFYGWWRIDFALLLLAMLPFIYGISLAMQTQQRHRKIYLCVGIITALGVLAFFKYANFGIHSLNILLEYAGIMPLSLLNILLPIGISFYIFHLISYLIDIARTDARPAQNFFDFSAFIIMFPHLVAGPVLKYKDMAGQMHAPDINLAHFNEGCRRFMIGFAKKILIADSIAPLTNMMFDLPDPTMADSALAALSYGIQLYFDFSGYSDMAIGLALMLGYRFIENFDRPYHARSVTDFWRRWHISLSGWLRDYVYIPLGGNRHGLRRTCINIFLVMALCGLWHGAGWPFLIWGMVHGMVMVVERLKPDLIPHTISPLLTFIFVMLAWIFFRADNLPHALELYTGLTGLNGFGLSEAVTVNLRYLAAGALMLGLLLVWLEPYLPRFTSIKSQILIVLLFMMAVIKLTAENYTPFLYFQF